MFATMGTGNGQAGDAQSWPRLVVKNTFLEEVFDEDDTFTRQTSAPASLAHGFEDDDGWGTGCPDWGEQACTLCSSSSPTKLSRMWVRTAMGKWRQIMLPLGMSPSAAQVVIATACNFRPSDATVLLRGRPLSGISQVNWEQFHALGDVTVSGRLRGGMQAVRAAKKEHSGSGQAAGEADASSLPPLCGPAGSPSGYRRRTAAASLIAVRQELATTRKAIAQLEKELNELKARAAQLERDLEPRAAEDDEAVEATRPQGANVPADFQELVDLGAGCVISDTADRGITLDQLRRLAIFIKHHCSRLAWKSTKSDKTLLQPLTTTSHDAVKHIVTPATTPRKCSYVELVARQEQPPQWFVSHWWGEPVLLFVSCLVQHAIDRKLKPSTSYWVCAYANNQHNLQAEIVSDPAKSSFRRAMTTAMGTISVVDREATCFTRVWCAYEVWVSLDPTSAFGTYKYDVYCALDDTRAVGFTDGLAEIDVDNGAEAEWRHVGGAHAHKTQREAAFPADVVEKACEVKLHEAAATKESDRRSILNAIAGRELELEPLDTHKNYESVTRALKWRIGLAAHALVEDGKVPRVRFDDLDAPESWAGRAAAAYLPMCEARAAQGRYGLAQGCGQRAVKAAEWELAKACAAAGKAMSRYGNPAGAGEHFDRALPIKQRLLGRKHPEVAEILNEQGACFWKRDEWDQALRCFEEALAIRKEALGEKHSDVGETLNDMGILFKSIGQRERALRCYEEALAIRKEALGDKHPDVGQTLSNMGALLRGMGERDPALRCYEKALGIRKEAFGDTHPEVGRTLNCMGALLRDMGERERALRCYEKALAILKEALGDKHREVGKTLSNMGGLLRDMGERERALLCCEEALAILKEALDDKHPDVVTTMWSVVLLHTDAGRHEVAAECYKEAARVYAQANGDDHEKAAEASAETAEARLRASGGQ